MTRDASARNRSLKTFLLLAGSNYSANISRAAASVLMRAVLDPVSVGLVNSLQLLATLLAPATLGSIYGAIRVLPTITEGPQRTALASTAFAASLVEGLVISAVVLPLILPAMVGMGYDSPLFWLAVPFAVVSRMLTVQESLLLTLQQFSVAVRARLIRTLEPFAALGVAALAPTASSFVISSTAFSLACFALGRRAYLSMRDGAVQFVKDGFHYAVRADRYSRMISLDRVAIVIANYLDPLIVAAVSGPGSLAGYYLGVNVRGLLLNVPNAVFWQRWASSVKTFEATGSDPFAGIRFLAGIWLAVCALLICGVLGLWLLVETIIPRYRPFLDEAAVAAMLAIPMTVSAMLRGSRMLNRKPGKLFLISCLRLAVFGSGLAVAQSQFAAVSPATIAWIGYLAAAVDSMTNSLDIAVDSRSARLPGAVALMVGLPPLIYFALSG